MQAGRVRDVCALGHSLLQVAQRLTGEGGFIDLVLTDSWEAGDAVRSPPLSNQAVYRAASQRISF